MNQVHNKHKNLFSISLKSEKRQIIKEVHYSGDIYLIFDYRALFVCVKNTTFLRTATSAYCFNICGSIFCLLDRSLILGCKTI